MKKIITLLILLFVNVYSYGQEGFLTIVGGNTTFNTGATNQVLLNPTGSNCASEVLVLNIGTLQYVPTSNDVPAGTSIIPSFAGSDTILTISNFSDFSSGGGSSQFLKIGVRFQQGICNTSTVIKARCNESPYPESEITVNSLLTNNATASITQVTSNGTPVVPFCLGQVVKYTITVNNTGTSSTSITTSTTLNLPQCAIIEGLYSVGSSIPISFTSVSGVVPQRIVWNNNVIGISSSKSYDLYVRFPCDSDPSENCVTGSKNLNVHIEGTTACGVAINTAPSTITTPINTGCVTAQCSGGNISTLQIGSSFPCATSCAAVSPSVSFTLETPPMNPAYSSRKFTVTIPTLGLINITSANFLTAQCAGSSVRYYGVSGNEITSLPSSLIKTIIFDIPCNTVTQLLTYRVNFTYIAPFSATSLEFGYLLEFGGAPSQNISATYSKTIEPCVQNPTRTKYVRPRNTNFTQIFSIAGAAPTNEFTYRLMIRNPQSEILNAIIQDDLNSNLEYIGGFRYAYENNFTPAPTSFIDLTDVENSFILPGTATVVNVVVPSSGANSLILNNFTLPCSDKYLIIEFNVRIRSTVSVPTIFNSFRINNFTSNNASIVMSTLPSVTSTMFAKCPTTTVWKENTMNVRNGEFIDFKMKVANSGSTPIYLSQLINLKPQPNDQYEIGTPLGNVPRNNASASTINYSCETPLIVSNLSTPPTPSYEFAQNGTNMDRSMLCPPTGTGYPPVWGAESTCSLNSNWFKVQFPPGFKLNPGEFVEVTYKTQIAGGLGTTRNSFAFRVVDASGQQCGVASDDAEFIIVNDGIGCVPLDPCTNYLGNVDGEFNGCNAVAGSNDFNSNINCGGWSKVALSPDTWKLPINTSLNPSINTQIPSSQNGGTFAGAIANTFSNGNFESFKTEVHDLIPGQVYRLDFEQINMTNLAFLNNSVNWKITFGDQVRFSPALTTEANPQWSNVSINFIASANTQTLLFEANSTIVTNPNVNYPAFSYLGIDNITVKNNVACPAPVACLNCTSFDLLKEEKYLVSGWVKEASSDPVLAAKQQFKNFDKSCISVSFTDVNGNPITLSGKKFYPTGEIIDGWQRIIGEFIVPGNVDDMHLELINENVAGMMSYFDDIRVLPSKGNMKSFVYDQQTQRLMAELDENNYSTFYEYDLEGGLIRIKKETEKGVFTIQETRSGNTKSGN